MFIQIASALYYCHTQGVVHLDVKLDNVMIDLKTGYVTLIDFGLCDFMAEQQDVFTRKVGSHEYCAPEMFEQNDKTFSGTKADVWCLGVALYAMLTGKLPFDPKKRKFEFRLSGTHPSVRVSFPCSESIRDLIHKMLTVNPEERISMAQVLSHPWVTGKQ